MIGNLNELYVDELISYHFESKGNLFVSFWKYFFLCFWLQRSIKFGSSISGFSFNFGMIFHLSFDYLI